MKMKQVLSMAVTAAGVLFCCAGNYYAEESAPLATLKTDEGAVSVIGGQTYTDEDGKNYFFALLEYTNGAGESRYPDYDFYVKAYQNGIELEHGYVGEDDVPDGYYDMYTSVRPETTLKFYEEFEMTEESDVEVEVGLYVAADDSSPVTCTIPVGGMASEETAAGGQSGDDAVNTDSASESSLIGRVEALEQKVAELEERIQKLENAQ